MSYQARVRANFKSTKTTFLFGMFKPFFNMPAGKSDLQQSLQLLFDRRVADKIFILFHRFVDSVRRSANRCDPSEPDNTPCLLCVWPDKSVLILPAQWRSSRSDDGWLHPGSRHADNACDPGPSFGGDINHWPPRSRTDSGDHYPYTADAGRLRNCPSCRFHHNTAVVRRVCIFPAWYEQRHPEHQWKVFHADMAENTGSAVKQTPADFFRSGHRQTGQKAVFVVDLQFYA